MRVLRILMAGLIAVGAMVAVFFAAVVVFLTGVAAYFLQLFRGQPAARQPAPPVRRRPTDDVIDVVTQKMPSEPDGPAS